MNGTTLNGPNAASFRVMLFIDADNVSADVISQAIAKVKADHGAIHVRRAHCTAEAALKHAKLFKSLSIRPIVNLASGKNSTDIALAVDAMEMVCAERPNLVVIVSSDSDFAPLVIRLREKGCRVCGIGQRGKTGDEVVEVYDEFIDFEHRKPPPAPRSAPPPRPPRPPRGGRGGERPPVAAREPERAEGRSSGGRGPRRPQQQQHRGGSEREPDRYVDLLSDRPTDLEIDRAMGWPPAERNFDRVESRPMPRSNPGRGRPRPSDGFDEPPIEQRMASPVAESAFEAIVEPVAPVLPEPVPDAPVIETATAMAEEGAAAPAKRSRRSRGGKAAREAATIAAAVVDELEPASDVPQPAAPATVAAQVDSPSRPPRPARAPRRGARSSPAATTGMTPEPSLRAPREAAPAEAEVVSNPSLLAAPPPPPLSDATLAALAASDLPSDVQRLLEAIPELLGGTVFELSHAAERLRAVGLLAKNAPSTKLFKKYPDLFVLTPGRQPNKVRFSGPALV